MAPGLRVEVQVTSQTSCPLADAAPDAEVRSVSRTRTDGEFVAEFVADDPVEGVETVFDYDTETVYRVVEESAKPCVCERVEQMGYPVRDHHVEDGAVTMAFFVPNVEALRSVLEEVATGRCSLTIRRLTRSGPSEEGALVYVDKAAFTERQLEVLRTANERGYFEHPKEANAGDVAAELGISTSTFAEHMAAAQRKLLGAVLD